MGYEDVPVNKDIKSWNTKILKVNRNKRHKDIIIKKDFWEDMSKFLTKYRG